MRRTLAKEKKADASTVVKADTIEIERNEATNSVMRLGVLKYPMDPYLHKIQMFTDNPTLHLVGENTMPNITILNQNSSGTVTGSAFGTGFMNTCQLGINSSTHSIPYSSFLWSLGNYPMRFGINNALVMSLNNTSATTAVSMNSAGVGTGSSSSLTYTLNPASSFTSDKAKFGSKSLYLPYSRSSGLTVQGLSTSSFSGAWTIEFWFFPLTGGSVTFLMSTQYNTTYRVDVSTSVANQLRLNAYSNSLGATIVHASSFNLNQWNHAAIGWNGTNTCARTVHISRRPLRHRPLTGHLSGVFSILGEPIRSRIRRAPSSPHLTVHSTVTSTRSDSAIPSDTQPILRPARPLLSPMPRHSSYITANP